MQTILLTGAGGFVGSRIQTHLQDHCRVVTFPRGMLGRASQEEVYAFVSETAPQVIIHSAAIADMGVCERDPDASYRANVQLTQWICRAASAVGAKALCFSSDQVYNGCDPADGPYREEMILSPANVYGRHKLEAEQRGLDILPSAVMLRATWMYDMPAFGLPLRGGFVCNLLRQALANEPAVYSETDYRGVTWVRQVAQLTEKAIALPGGAYNFGSPNTLHMADTAREGLRALGLGARADELVVPDGSQPKRCLLMDPGKLNAAGLAFDDTVSGLRRCLAAHQGEAWIPHFE